jgi:hypothetical protein
MYSSTSRRGLIAAIVIGVIAASACDDPDSQHMPYIGGPLPLPAVLATKPRQMTLPPPGVIASFRWSRLDAPGGPRAYAGGSAYDTTNDRLLWFGGCQDSYVAPSAKMWALALGESQGSDSERGWELLPSSEIGPEARGFTLAIVERASNRLWIFGGQRISSSWKDSFFLNDLWALDMNLATPEWKLVIGDEPSKPPAGRIWSSGSFDDTGKRVVVFGGATLTGTDSMSGDTWAAGGVRSNWGWHAVSDIPQGPGPRSSPCFAYHEGLDGLVVSGGAIFGEMKRDVWFLPFSGPSRDEWIRVTVTSDRPLPYAMCDCAFDPQLSRILCFGGGEMHPGDQYAQDTSQLWLLTLTSQSTGFWQFALTIGDPPESHMGSNLLYDSKRDRFVRAFGAWNDAEGIHASDETWAVERAPL